MSTIGRTGATLLLAVMHLSVVAVGLQTPENRPRLIRNVFPKATAPIGVMLDGAGWAALRESVVPLVPSLLSDSRGMVLLLLRAQDTVEVPCSLIPHPPNRSFDDNDNYSIELTTSKEHNIIGTPLAVKASWVRPLPDFDLTALHVTNLHGRAVVGAFTEDKVAAAKYVVLYRRKHWPAANHSDSPADACGGHTHLQATWGILGSE